MNLITSIDFLGNEPKTFIFKKNLHQTFLGGCLSIITALVITSLSLYFISMAFSRHQVDLLSSQTTRFEKSLNLTNIPILFSPANKDGVLFNTSVVYPVFQYWTFPPKAEGAVKVTNIPFKQCGMSDVIGYEDLFANFPDLQSFYCLNKVGLNLTLSGDNGDINNGYAKINVYVAKCKNDSIYNPNPNRQGCMPQDKLDVIVTSAPIILYLTFPDYEIDFQNLTNPYIPYIRTENFIFATQAMNSYLYYLKQTFITSDYGFVLEDKVKIGSYQSDTMQSVTSLGSAYFVQEAFGVFQLALSSKADMHNRSYIKLQSLVANIGGVVNFIYLLAKILVSYVAEKSLLIEYVNNRCNYKPSEVKNPGQLSAINLRVSENNVGGIISNIQPQVIQFKIQQQK
jgi:hypothetical protein